MHRSDFTTHGDSALYGVRATTTLDNTVCNQSQPCMAVLCPASCSITMSLWITPVLPETLPKAKTVKSSGCTWISAMPNPAQRQVTAAHLCTMLGCRCQRAEAM